MNFPKEILGTYAYSVPLTGGCGSVNATGTITVNGDNTVVPTREYRRYDDISSM